MEGFVLQLHRSKFPAHSAFCRLRSCDAARIGCGRHLVVSLRARSAVSISERQKRTATVTKAASSMAVRCFVQEQRCVACKSASIRLKKRIEAVPTTTTAFITLEKRDEGVFVILFVILGMLQASYSCSSSESKIRKLCIPSP